MATAESRTSWETVIVLGAMVFMSIVGYESSASFGPGDPALWKFEMQEMIHGHCSGESLT